MIIKLSKIRNKKNKASPNLSETPCQDMLPDKKYQFIEENNPQLPNQKFPLKPKCLKDKAFWDKKFVPENYRRI